MSREPSRGLWIWRAGVTLVLMALLAWGGLGEGLSELLLIALGSGLIIMVTDLVRTRRRVH